RRRRKHESHAVAGWSSNQITRSFRTPKCLCASDDLIKVLEQLMLLIDQSPRITDDVYEQDMGNLQSKFGFRFGHKTNDVCNWKTSNVQLIHTPQSKVRNRKNRQGES